MDGIGRRGFIGGLAALFGYDFAPHGSIGGDVADEIDGPGDCPAKKADPVAPGLATHASPGSIITIEFMGMRCQALVEDVEVEMARPAIDLSSDPIDRKWVSPGPTECSIRLSLRSVGEIIRFSD